MNNMLITNLKKNQDLYLCRSYWTYWQSMYKMCPRRSKYFCSVKKVNLCGCSTGSDSTATARFTDGDSERNAGNKHNKYDWFRLALLCCIKLKCVNYWNAPWSWSAGGRVSVSLKMKRITNSFWKNWSEAVVYH